MPKDKKRKMADHPPYERGPKTHRADVRVNRGEHEEPEPEKDPHAGEEVESRREKELREERPTYMKATRHNPDRRNRKGR